MMLSYGEGVTVLIYSWIIHWILIQWAMLKINQKDPSRDAGFAPLATRGEFGGLLVAQIATIQQTATSVGCRDPPRSEFSNLKIQDHGGKKGERLSQQ